MPNGPTITVRYSRSPVNGASVADLSSCSNAIQDILHVTVNGRDSLEFVRTLDKLSAGAFEELGEKKVSAWLHLYNWKEHLSKTGISDATIKEIESLTDDERRSLSRLYDGLSLSISRWKKGRAWDAVVKEVFKAEEILAAFIRCNSPIAENLGHPYVDHSYFGSHSITHVDIARFLMKDENLAQIREFRGLLSRGLSDELAEEDSQNQKYLYYGMDGSMCDTFALFVSLGVRRKELFDRVLDSARKLGALQISNGELSRRLNRIIKTQNKLLQEIDFLHCFDVQSGQDVDGSFTSKHYELIGEKVIETMTELYLRQGARSIHCDFYYQCRCDPIMRAPMDLPSKILVIIGKAEKVPDEFLDKVRSDVREATESAMPRSMGIYIHDDVGRDASDRVKSNYPLMNGLKARAMEDALEQIAELCDQTLADTPLALAEDIKLRKPSQGAVAAISNRC